MSNPAGADFRSVARTAAPAGCRVETSVAPGRPHCISLSGRTAHQSHRHSPGWSACILW